MNNWSGPRIILILAGLVVATTLFSVGPSVDSATGDETVRILVIVLSILSGFLIAAITMLGDPKRLPDGSWRVASADRRRVRRPLDRLIVLFYAYLLAIFLAFVISILQEHVTDFLSRWLTHAVLSFGAAVLVWSFGIPSVIQRELRQNLDREVENRRKNHPSKQLEPL